MCLFFLSQCLMQWNPSISKMARKERGFSVKETVTISMFKEKGG